MSLVLDEHRQYLADTARLDAFEAALRALVKPGDVVLDLASGTGILGLLACQAGAGRVYAIEMESIVELARQIARDNNFTDRIVCIRDLSTRASLPKPVDLIVTDLAGRFGIDAGIIETLSDARRFLKPGGRIIPSTLTLWLAPVEERELWEQVAFWTRPVRGLSFRAAHTIARSTGYPRHIQPEEILSSPRSLPPLDPSRDTGLLSSGELQFVVDRAATLHGIGGWFSADLAPGVTLTNAPGAPTRINRSNVLFPLREPVPVACGDTVTVSMDIRPTSLVVRWSVEVRAAANGRLCHRTDASTFEGMLISREEMTRTRPTFQPSLTPAGAARKTVLDLCDGRRTLAEIEREVLRRHAGLFRSASDAAAFVAEVVTRYTN